MSIERKGKKIILSSVLLVTAVFIFLFSLFGILYCFDNKYSLPPPYGKEGYFVFDDDSLSKPIALIDGWELYPDVLYSPKDFTEKSLQPKRYTFIGQYSNFSFFNESQSPFGCATYRLTLSYNEAPKNLVLYIPEIFTEYKLYANGEIISSTGQNGIVAVVVDKSTELVLCVKNNSHYYSGLTYPMMLGESAVIGRMLLIKNIFYGVLFLFPLSLFLFAVASLFTKGYNQRFLHFGLLCLFFSLQSSYHFLHGLGISGTALYALEDTARMLVLYEIIELCTLECDLFCKLWYRRFVKPICITFCILTAIIIIFIIPNAGWIVNVYGNVIDVYRVLCFIYLCVCAIYGILHCHNGSPLVLAACAANGVSIYLNIVQNSRFEPIYTGWQTEYTTLVIVILFWFLAIQHVRELVILNKQLTGDLSTMVHQRTSELHAVLDERKMFFSNLAHDMKAPIASIHGFVNLILRGNMYVDDELKEYLTLIGDEAAELGQRVNSLSELHSFDKITEPPEKIDLNELLIQVYKDNEPETCVAGILFEISLLNRPAYIFGVRKKLLILFENLIINAVSFTPEDGKIRVAANIIDQKVIITVSDSGCGIPDENLPQIFDRFFSFRENQSNGSGLGLYIVKTTVDEMRGTIQVASALNEGTTFIIEFPVVGEK